MTLVSPVFSMFSPVFYQHAGDAANAEEARAMVPARSKFLSIPTCLLDQAERGQVSRLGFVQAGVAGWFLPPRLLPRLQPLRPAPFQSPIFLAAPSALHPCHRCQCLPHTTRTFLALHQEGDHLSAQICKQARPNQLCPPNNEAASSSACAVLCTWHT